MNHLIIIYYFFVLVGGVVSLTTIIHTCLASRDKTITLYVVFFIFFSLSVFLRLVSYYLKSNVIAVPYLAGLIISAVQLVLDTAIVFSAMVFFNELFAIKARTLINLLSGSLFLLGLVLFFTPFSIRIDYAAESMKILPLGNVIMGLYVIGFSYLIFIGLFHVGKEKRRREKIFKAAMLAFALVGYGEMISGKIFKWDVAGYGLELHFYISTIPYFLWSVFSIFFFLKYYRPKALVDENFTVSPAFAEKYSITKREMEIINLVARGLTNQAIGQTLFVSLATIKTHLHNIFEKTGVKGRMALLYLLRNTE